MQRIISAKNSKTLRESEPVKKKCSCTQNKKSECPLQNKCLESEIVYQATVEVENQPAKTYIGQTSTDFKHRLSTHTFSFNNREINQTSLSQYVWSLKDNGHEPKISWKIVDRGRKFSPVHATCQLCITEAYYINFHPEMAALNSKSEIFSSCRHKKPALLIKPKRGRKRKPPGTWKLLIWSCDFYLYFSYCCMPEESRWFICLKLRVAVQWLTEIKTSSMI